MQNEPEKINAEAAVLKQVLANPRRLEILSFLTREQGGTEADLAAGLGLALPQVGYHLRVLEGAGLVAEVTGPEQGVVDRYLVATASR